MEYSYTKKIDTYSEEEIKDIKLLSRCCRLFYGIYLIPI